MHYKLLWKFLLGHYPSFFNDLESTIKEAKFSWGAVNNMKDRFSFYLPEERVKLLHNIMIYFSCQMNKNKSKKSHHTRNKKTVWILNDIWSKLSN